MIHIILLGVYLTGMLKDLFSLPRPLSPPLHRLSMSDHAAAEYGFPSTHSANSVGIASFALHLLHGSDLSPEIKFGLQMCIYFYALTIVFGRLYCGMHGFLDVAIGSSLGILLTVLTCVTDPIMDQYLYNGSWEGVAVMTLATILLIRVYPEPADDCPCFDDSVCSLGVIAGINLGLWHYAASGHAWNWPTAATVPFSLEVLGWTVTLTRIVLGITILVVWRAVLKAVLLRALPPVFRLLQPYGLGLPRRSYKPASEYETIPADLDIDRLMPSISEIPRSLDALQSSAPGQGDIIGPQSAADVYEAVANRDIRRRGSANSHAREDLERKDSHASAGNGASLNGTTKMTTESMVLPGKEDDEDSNASKDATELFAQIHKPRVRYDVEILTKLIVYIGA